MFVSRYALQSYNIPNEYFFANRTERDSFFLGKNIDVGTMCAVGGDKDSEDWSSAIWEADQYNGSNWATLDLTQNFALIVTNEGIAALTDASTGQYKLQLSRILIKQTPIPLGTQVAAWTLSDFKSVHGYSDICLDTNNAVNTTFSLERNLTYRTNLLNGGIQFTVQLGVNCMGQYIVGDTDSPNVYPTLTEFDVAAIGLCVKDQRENSNNQDILFAVANLPIAVGKIASTPNRVGNDLKFYLNTTLSNFGNVVNLKTITSSVGSVPEVMTEDDLTNNYNGENAPYNLYIVDSLADTNIPAIAVRKGDPTSPSNPITWTYFTPTDDNILVDENLTDPLLKNFMVAAWDTNIAKYVPADSKNNQTQSLSGLFNRKHILYAGKVTNVNSKYAYSFNVNTNSARDYKNGEELICKVSDNIVYNMMISRTTVEDGKPVEWTISPTSGNVLVNQSDLSVIYPQSKPGDGTGLKMSISSTLQSNDVNWNFPIGWINKPLYVDYDHTDESTTEWNDYLTTTGLAADTPRDRKGLLTIIPTSMFVGWCVNRITIKLALDLRNEATETTYGTTRYSTDNETKDVAGNDAAKDTTSVTPKRLQDNYVQKTLVAGNPGSAWNNPIEIDTYTQFSKTIVGKGVTPTQALIEDQNLSFYGLAYRAWWEDLAEYYKSDKLYPAGTLICIGAGLAEITEARSECNGIISTKPGYELGKKSDSFDLPVALIGKVPVLFDGNCVPEFGDRVYLSKIVPGRASTVPFGKCLGKVIDKREHLDQRNDIMCSVRIEF